MLGRPSKRLWVVAHRGGCALRPENTLAAFRHAISLGVDMVEADVKRTRDGRLVLFHGDSLESTTNGHGPIGELTLDELQHLDAGSHLHARYRAERIPTLEDLLHLARNRVEVLLDLKAHEQYQEQIVELIGAYQMELKVVVGVRTVEALRQVKEQNPAIRVLSLGGSVQTAFEILDAGADIVRLWEEWTTAESVRRALDASRPVWVMVGGPACATGRTTRAELERLREQGVSGVILDDPRLALEASREG